MRWTVNAAARSHLMPLFQCGLWATQGLSIIHQCLHHREAREQENRACGIKKLKLYSPQQQSLYTFIGLQYLWLAIRWRLLATAAAAAGRCSCSVLLHLTLITGPEKGRPGVHVEEPGWSPPMYRRVNCHYFHHKEGAIQNECPKD